MGDNEGGAMPLSRHKGVFEPADLEMIQRVFDQLCKKRLLLPADTVEREELAAEIVDVYRHGVHDEAGLMQALSKRHRRR